MTADLHIIGAGLIGTSIGLALRDRWDVVLSDARPDAQAKAVARGAGRRWDGGETARLLVVAAPPAATAAVIRSSQRLNLALTFSHVSSIQAPVQVEIESLGCALESVCGGHPLAGRERSGPEAAVAGLFEGRPWVLCPAPQTSPDTLDAVRELAVECGAEPVVMGPLEHDRAVALVSHLPQVAASAVAAQLLRADAPGAARLAGPGLQDTTRVAGSDAGLWMDVLRGNAVHLAPLVHALARDLGAVADALSALAGDPGEDEASSLEVIGALLRRGADGRRLVPLKRGAHDEDFVTVHVSVPDRPGQLAGILLTAAEAGVNVEDVHVEHLRGRPRGVVRLLVHGTAVVAAQNALRHAGWEVVGTG